jgi:hypothetical protein
VKFDSESLSGKKLGEYLKIGDGCFLPNSSLFIIHRNPPIPYAPGPCPVGGVTVQDGCENSEIRKEF